jgi:hypothetical protein
MPRKILHSPRLIVNVDGTPNKAGAVKEACILEITHQGRSFLQRFYVMDLGFDQVLLGYPWLTTFNPNIDWKKGVIEGDITLKTTANAWERWKELRWTMAVARVQIETNEESDSEVWNAIARTNFAQDWSREANKAKQEQTANARLPEEYQRHAIVFSEEAAKRFPPSRPEDHAIKLKEGAPVEINCKIYPLTRPELEAMRKFIDDNLKLGYIEECDEGGSPWSTPWFFTGKKDGSLRPLQDYRVVNSWTVRDVYPIPRIEQILEELEGKTLFTALDIWWGYHNIRIRDEDQWKAAFKTPCGFFKPKVMFFGLTNSPATFQRFMDRIFAPLKWRYPGLIFVYMDDILIATGGDRELHR